MSDGKIKAEGLNTFPEGREKSQMRDLWINNLGSGVMGVDPSLNIHIESHIFNEEIKEPWIIEFALAI